MSAEIIAFKEPEYKLKCSFCSVTYTKRESFNGFSNGLNHICHNCLTKCAELIK